MSDPPDIVSEIPRLQRYAKTLIFRSRYYQPQDIGAATDDLVHDTIVRALSRIEQFQPGTSLTSWLMTIMHSQYVNSVRTSVHDRLHYGYEDDAIIERIALPTIEGQSARLLMRDLDRAMTKLSPQMRAVLLLVGMEGMQYEEAAALLNVATGTVRSRLSRARDELRLIMFDEERQRQAAGARSGVRKPSGGRGAGRGASSRAAAGA